MRSAEGALALCLLPVAASAQIASTAPDLATAEQMTQGPMKVERIHNGFLAAPDFKFTDFDHKTSGLMGGYAGVEFGHRLSNSGKKCGRITVRAHQESHE